MTPPEPVTVKRGAAAAVKLTATLNEGFHLNSNKPNEAYLIPLSLRWEPGVLESTGTDFPKAQEIKGPSEKPMSVYTGKFVMTAHFKAAPTAAPGPAMATGKLRYQACNEKSCFPPKSVEVKVPVQIQ